VASGAGAGAGECGSTAIARVATNELCAHLHVVIDAAAGRALDSLAESTYFAAAMWESPNIAWRDYRPKQSRKRRK